MCYIVQLLSFLGVSKYDLTHFFAINFIFALIPDFLTKDSYQRLNAPLVILEQVMRNLISINKLKPFTFQDIAYGALSTCDPTSQPNHDHFDPKVKRHEWNEIHPNDVDMLAKKYEEDALLEHKKCTQEVFVFQYAISLGEQAQHEEAHQGSGDVEIGDGFDQIVAQRSCGT
jgi:hypothetical protein